MCKNCRYWLEDEGYRPQHTRWGVCNKAGETHAESDGPMLAIIDTYSPTGDEGYLRTTATFSCILFTPTNQP